jgi:hypothetical protein
MAHRDSTGLLLNVWFASHAFGSLTWAEAKAALYAISTAIHLKFKFVHFEGDAKVVINTINFPSSLPPWEIVAILDNIRSLLPFFTYFDFLFCPRGQNGLAHFVALWASFCKTWGPHPISSIPSWVLSEEQECKMDHWFPLSLFNVII